MKTIAVSLVLILVGGCAVNPAYERPGVDSPKNWRNAKTVAEATAVLPDREWWRAFNDPGLNEFQAKVLVQNYELKAAGQRIAQARATAKGAASLAWPSIDANVGVERTSNLSGRKGQSTYATKLSASYEPDIWDKFQNTRKAADAGLVAATEAERVTATTLLSDAANTYFLVKMLSQRIELVQMTIAAAERVDSVVETRYAAGAVSGLDRAQSKTSLASIRASLPPLEQARAEAEHALALLLGQPPGDMTLSADSLMQIKIPKNVSAGMPSELLQRRPDIRLAEANLVAAHANIGVARANLYPSIKLTGDAGYESAQLRNLLRGSSGLLSIAADLLVPIFDRSRLVAASDQAKARYEELALNYRQSIISAFRDVENALVAQQKQAALETEQTEVATQAQKAFELAELRYKVGLTDAINLLTAQNVYLNAQSGLLQARLGRINAHVSLYKALGGGW
jgi:outer membrane protein, multidrug efflux system